MKRVESAQMEERRWEFDYRAECGLYVGGFYCSVCGLVITLCPLKPAELAARLADACKDCGEPLAVALCSGDCAGVGAGGVEGLA